MKYPNQTISKPVSGQEAKQLIDAVENGRSMTNDAAKATIGRILEKRRNRNSQNVNGQSGEVRKR
jgi:hypothetical protein